MKLHRHLLIIALMFATLCNCQTNNTSLGDDVDLSVTTEVTPKTPTTTESTTTTTRKRSAGFLEKIKLMITDCLEGKLEFIRGLPDVF